MTAQIINIKDLREIKNLKDEMKKADEPHYQGELICLNCHDRAQNVWNQKIPLRYLICQQCRVQGMLIATGAEWFL